MRFNADMAETSRTRVIAAPPDVVWRVLADFGALSSWARNVDHSCLLEHGPDPIGTSRRVQVGENTFVERITEFTAPHALAYDIEGLPPKLGRVSNRWSLTPTGTGSTEVTLTSSVQIGKNPVARLAEKAACQVLAKQSDPMLAGLAAKVEGSHV
jgi:uncharacterized protein YndB with AHSA1/START domain